MGGIEGYCAQAVEWTPSVKYINDLEAKEDVGGGDIRRYVGINGTDAKFIHIIMT